MSKIPRKKAAKPIHIKDPQKVAAGKARAANAYRMGGKYIGKEVIQKIEQDAKEAGAKDAFAFFMQNQREYETVYNSMMLTTPKDFYKLKKEIRAYNGVTYKNNVKVKKATVIQALNTLNQYLKIEHEVVAFWLPMEISLTGKLNINIPSIAQIQKRLQDGEDISDIMDNEGISVIISTDKKNNEGKK